MEFTKQERHEIYKKAYGFYIDHLNIKNLLYTKRWLSGMCVFLRITIHSTYNIDMEDVPLEVLSEFVEIKPVHVLYDFDEYWWPVGDVEIRKKTFEKLIEMTK